MSPCLVLAAICGPAAPAPAPVQTSVELRITSVDEGEAKLLEQSLRRELSDRLLQDGYRVVPSGEAASVGVWVHLDHEGARVHTRGEQQRVETIAAGNPEVVVLEVLQLTTALVDEVRPTAATPRPAVALQLDGEALDPQLRERLQVGLLERGFALTRQPSARDQRLCMVAAGEALAVHVTAGDRACDADAPATPVATGETIELRRALLLDGATAALDDWTQATATASESTHLDATPASDATPALEVAQPLPVPAPSPEPARLAERAEQRAASITVTAHGGLVGRVGGPDGTFGMRLRAGRRRGLGGGIELLVIPSKAEGLRVVESVPAAIFEWRLGFARRGIAAFGTFAGLHVHNFTQTSAAGTRGVRLGPSLGTTVRLAFLGTRGLMAFGGLRAGWSGGRWIHLLDGRETWERSGLLVGLELGAGWDFRWGRRA